jgi:hypothetical protein
MSLAAGSHPDAWNWLAPAFHIFRDVCSKCFRSMFHIDVAHVVMVIRVCCKSLFKMFHLFQTHIITYKYFIWMLHIFQWLCCKVCSKYLICFKHILQLFHLSIAKVDLDVGLLSEEERASLGAMAVSMWGGGAGRAVPVWKRHRIIWAAWKRRAWSNVEEAGEALAERKGAGPIWRWKRSWHGGTWIRVTMAEQARMFGHVQPSNHLGASLALNISFFI